MLADKGVKSHFISKLSETEQLVKRVKIIPLEVVVRNLAAGSLSKRLGVPEGKAFTRPMVEFYYKNDDLGDPILTEDHIREMELATPEELKELKNKALEVNSILSLYFKDLGINLVDFKLEFGIDQDGNILLADEISPDTCRLWDIATNEKLDKDVFRRDLGSLTEAYTKILKKVVGQTACTK
jgi:phosphoribosylaminoimidazole-succinocarboxamide synthase